MRFLLDENIPIQLGVALRSEGHDVIHVSETSLRSANDKAIWAYGSESSAIFVTADLGFPLPAPKPAGMILIRHAQRVTLPTFLDLALNAIRSLGKDLDGRLVVISPGRTRVSRL
jgi:predicted nuclease of predicted toxin-antitoxin system